LDHNPTRQLSKPCSPRSGLVTSTRPSWIRSRSI
jgi:hypothetical protein